ncbi:maltose operon periplasmic protein MalM [Photobacterium aquae]|uniref:Maltose operon periplasmic protein MalM n=1 Tax=Photobacterium aquae TaxID=1195763 RepID=A0A0J1H599_9GAMM|nr:MalM family protein [Photobacterium aquae]KLV06959.1 maltose operon periplasmic protein MalM [Photobacterium aquae]
MKIIKTTLAALLIASLAGCAASPAEQAVKNVTITQPACCETFSEFAWIPMNGDSIDFAVDEYSQVGNFAEGKSYFTGFVLPENVERMRVELKSWMRSTGVFAPKVLLLSPTFQVVDSYELSDFEVKPSDMLRLSSYRKSFDMNQATTPYLVVYSPLAYREGSIQIPHPERVRAEELGLARPMVTDPTIQHQKFGSLELDLKPLALRSYRSHTTVPQKAVSQPVETAESVEAVATVPAASMVLSNTAVQQSSAVNSPAMLPETEAFYNNQIQLAVEKKDIQRALKLMEEAKRAGSATAENTFIKLIQK